MIYSFLLIGQSNMSGRGRYEDVDPIHNDNVFMFRNGEWKTAVEPIHDDKIEKCAVGLSMSFADEIQKKFGIQVGLIPSAVGGTSLEKWAVGKELYTNAVAKTKLATKESKLVGILWHQGEADSKAVENAHKYCKKFSKIISSMKGEIAANDLPVLMGGLGDFLANRNLEENMCEYVTKEIKRFCEENNGFKFVPANGLTDNGDNVHFNAKSLREFGLRYAEAFVDINKIL